MHLAEYLGMLHRSEVDLAAGLRHVASAHTAEVDIHHLANRLAVECDDHVRQLAPHMTRYGDVATATSAPPVSELFGGPRTGGLGLLRDLHDVYVLTASCEINWIVVGEAAQAARDGALSTTVEYCSAQTARHLRWLESRMKTAAPQALVVA